MPIDHHSSSRPGLTRRDLDIALSTAASLQTSIRHADTKAATLLGVQGGVATLAAQQTTTLFDTEGIAVMVAIAAILAIALLGGLSGTTWHLISAIAPRLTRPAGHNRFAFPTATRSRQRHTTVDAQQQCDEAWELVSVLGRTAMAKHAHVRRSLPWLTLTMTCEGGLLVLHVLLGVMA